MLEKTIKGPPKEMIAEVGKNKELCYVWYVPVIPESGRWKKQEDQSSRPVLAIW